MATVTKSTSKPTADDDGDISYDFTEWCDNNSFGTLAVFNISFTLIGLISAIFLLLLIAKNPALRGDRYLLLNNLVWAAVILLTITGFVYTEEAINPCWYAGKFLCKIVHFVKAWLTNVSTFLLVGLAIQQLNRYRRKFTTFFNASHTRWMITIGAIWVLALVVSIPELVVARVLYYDEEGIFVLCGVYKIHAGERLTSTAKVLFVEYIAPFLILIVVTIVTGFYVFMVRSQYTTFGVTTGESLMVQDRNHPHHFVLIACLAVVYVLGYFPLYSYELASFLESFNQDGIFKHFWLHMDMVSTICVLVPPALVPIFVLCLSWMHRDALKAVYHSMAVSIFDETAERNGNEEKIDDPVDVSFQDK